MALATVPFVARTLRPPAPGLPTYGRVTSESGTIFSARFAPDSNSIIFGAAWNGKPDQVFTTVGNTLQTQPLNIALATLLAVSKKNELALAMNGTHTGQLETIDAVLATVVASSANPGSVRTPMPSP